MNRYNTRQKYGMGWFLEPTRHSLARKGIKTGRKSYAKFIVPPPKGSEVLFGVGTKAYDDLHKKNLLTVEAVKDSLPHGSGINGDWNIYEKDGKIIAENYYDTMDEMGFYDRPAYFKLVIDKKNPKDFKLHFTDKTSQYLNQKYMLRNYLEDTISFDLEEELKKKGIDYSIEAYKGRGVFDPFYESHVDSDGDNVPDLYDLHPTDPNKAIEWSKKQEWKWKKYLGSEKQFVYDIYNDFEKNALKKYNKDLVYKFSSDNEKRKYFKSKDPKERDLYRMYHNSTNKIIEKHKKIFLSKQKKKINYAVTWDWAKKDKKALYRIFAKENGQNFGSFYNVLSTSEQSAISQLRKKMYKLKIFNITKIRQMKKTKINYTKPEIKGQQLRIRVTSPKECVKYGTQDVGKKGKLQRVACVKPKKGWVTQSWRMNLKDYKNLDEVKKDLNKIRTLSDEKKELAMKKASEWFRRIDYAKFLMTVHKSGYEPIDRFFVDAPSRAKALKVAKGVIDITAERYPSELIGERETIFSKI